MSIIKPKPPLAVIIISNKKHPTKKSRYAVANIKTIGIDIIAIDIVLIWHTLAIVPNMVKISWATISTHFSAKFLKVSRTPSDKTIKADC